MAETKFTIANKEWARKQFPGRLRKIAMKAHGYTPGSSQRGLVTAIHEKTGVSKATISRWLDGSMFPGIERLLLLSDRYEVTPDELVGNDDVPHGQEFSMDALEKVLPRPLLLHVLAVMSELRASAKNLTDEWYAEATVQLLERVSENPEMSRHEILGLAYELLRDGPAQEGQTDESAVDSQDR